MRLIHDIGYRIALQHKPDMQPLWSYTYSGKPKPYFHPVCTPAGHCVTNFEPHDHVWHRGMWFTIKFINGENFWEEVEPFGTQHTVAVPTVAGGDAGSIVVSSELEWIRPDGQSAVFHERREFSFVPLEPRAYALDFDIRLTAQADLLLDRTPFTTWGGYGGLIFRGTRNWQQTQVLLADGTTTERPVGVPATWCALSGKLDGGYQQTGGYAIFDHPSNLRHPTPWYGGAKDSNYLNAAFLFHEPLTVQKHQTLTFKYRVLVHDEIWDQARLQAIYEEYVATSQN